MIPNQGWLDNPVSFEVEQYLLPEVHQVFYYVCNPGPYNPLYKFQPQLIKSLTIAESFKSKAGYKDGTWGWVVGINWYSTFGDALIDTVLPPTEPVPDDENCPPSFIPTVEIPLEVEMAIDECPPGDLSLALESRTELTLVVDEIAEDTLTDDEVSAITMIDDGCPGSRIGEGCE